MNPEITMTVKDFSNSLLDAYNRGRIDEKYTQAVPSTDTKPFYGCSQAAPQQKKRSGRPKGSKNKNKKWKWKQYPAEKDSVVRLKKK